MPAGYSDLDAINAFLADIASQYPGLAQVIDSRQFSVGTTFEGRLMPLIKISANVTVDEDEPVFLINGAHHAREIVTPHLVMDTVQRLVSGYGVDSVITEVLNSRALILAPVWNPDGYVVRGGLVLGARALLARFSRMAPHWCPPTTVHVGRRQPVAQEPQAVRRWPQLWRRPEPVRPQTTAPRPQ